MNTPNYFRPALIGLALLATSALSGCATTEQTESSYSGVTASDLKVTRVNQAARDSRVTVVWVNPPNANRRTELKNGFELELTMFTPASSQTEAETDAKEQQQP
ncbi:MAG: hypothetical protein AAGH65_01690 [Pseudomonadota bacterium]